MKKSSKVFLSFFALTGQWQTIKIHQKTFQIFAHFFQVYKDLEGKKVEIIGWESSKQAKQVIVESKNGTRILSNSTSLHLSWF